MEPTSIDLLQRLLPEIAIAVIFAYILLKIVKMFGDAHEAKTKLFIEEIHNRDALLAKLTEKVIKLTEENTEAAFGVKESLNVNSKAIDNNTKAVQDSSNNLGVLMRKVISTNNNHKRNGQPV